MLKIALQIKNSLWLEALQELLPQAGIQLKENEKEAEGIIFSHSCSSGSLPSLNFSSLPQPLRFVEFLSLLENLPYKGDITFAHFSLDLREKTLTNNKTKEVQRLTEKESQLLRFFYHNKGQELSKERLLKEIWEYHPDTETHTLETHIYRLRQKIEEDPNVPQVLLNGKEGYLIK